MFLVRESGIAPVEDHDGDARTSKSEPTALPVASEHFENYGNERYVANIVFFFISS